MRANTVLIERDQDVNLALRTINRLPVLAKLLNLICNKLRCPDLIHSVLEFGVVNDRGRLREAKSLTSHLKFFFADFSEPCEVSIGQAEHVELVILSQLENRGLEEPTLKVVN